MQFTFGRGKRRNSVTIPHVSVRSRDEQEKVCEDAKALLLRPATFNNHSGSF